MGFSPCQRDRISSHGGREELNAALDQLLLGRTSADGTINSAGFMVIFMVSEWFLNGLRMVFEWFMNVYLW